MKKIKIQTRNGFSILAVILIVVAVIVAIGTWALSGQANTSAASSNTARIQASSIANDSSAIKLAYDTLVINGTAPSSITFLPNTSSSTNMLDPSNGITQPQVNSAALFPNAVEPDGLWVFTKKLTPNYTGSNSAHDAILISGIKDTVCLEINNSVNGTNTIPSYASFTNSNQFTQGATKADPNIAVVLDFQSNGLSAGNVTENWTSGCISASGTANQNMYFRILR